MHLAKSLGAVVRGAICTAVGVWLGSILPVQVIASSRMAANLAAGYAPNMDPAVMVTLAAMFAVLCLGATMVAELVRCWALGGKRLAAIAYVALGVCVSCPIAFAIATPSARVGPLSLLLLTGIGFALFHLARRTWLSARRRAAAGTA